MNRSPSRVYHQWGFRRGVCSEGTENKSDQANVSFPVTLRTEARRSSCEHTVAPKETLSALVLPTGLAGNCSDYSGEPLAKVFQKYAELYFMVG